MKKLLCLIICSFLICASICPIFALNTSSGESSPIGNMERVTGSVPFDFEIVSVGRDSVTAAFVSTGRIADPPYVGIKGTKTVAEKTSALQYVLNYDTEYSFVYTVTEGDVKTVYNSFITVETDGTPAVVFGDVIKNIVDPNSTRSAGQLTETESNNLRYLANTTYDDFDNYGALYPNGDTDWWQVTFTEAGTANFWLGNIPSGFDYDIALFDDENYHLGSSANYGQTDELIQFPVVAGKTYYIAITSYNGLGSTSQYLFRTKNYPFTTPDDPTPPETITYTWYSQYNSASGTGWDSTNLSKLYFPNIAPCKNCENCENNENCENSEKCANTPLYTDSSFTPAANQLSSGHMNVYGCYVCSIAMILRNLNVTTTVNRYDFRTGTTAKLPADPFTITMANIGWQSIIQMSPNRYEVPSYTSSVSPVSTYRDIIASNFGLTAYTVDLSNTTAEEKADILAYYIANNPEGILIRVAHQHSIVFTQSSHPVSMSRTIIPEAIEITSENEHLLFADDICCGTAPQSRVVSSTDFDDKFICYDPGTTDPTKGMGVPYDESISATSYGGLDVISYLVYFD